MSVNKVPDYAEQIDLTLVFRTRQQPSKFVPGIMATVAYIRCPACDTAHDRDLSAGRTNRCECGLHMQSTGSGFFIWRAPAQAAE